MFQRSGAATAATGYPPTPSTPGPTYATSSTPTTPSSQPSTAQTAESPSPPQTPVVQVKFVDAKVGFSVFALGSLQRGQQVYRESIVLQATHHAHPRGPRNAYERYRSLPALRRAAMHGAYPALAAANGVGADEAAGYRGLVGSLVQGGAGADTVDVAVTADQHRRMRRPWPQPLGGRFRDARSQTLEWFGRYAFRLDPADTFTGEPSQAGVYLLTGLVNHRCPGFFNCRVVAGIDEIKLVAERDIAPGEELTINYGKAKKDFSCRGPCCRR